MIWVKKSSVKGKPKTLLEVFYPVRSEFDEQVEVFKWAAIARYEFPELDMLVGSLNGVRLTIGAAVKAKRAGLKKGYPDITLDVRRGEFVGLKIEMKKAKENGGGVLSPEQKWWLWQLTYQGRRAVCCYGTDQAIEEIKQYLRLPSHGKFIHNYRKGLSE